MMVVLCLLPKNSVVGSGNKSVLSWSGVGWSAKIKLNYAYLCILDCSWETGFNNWFSGLVADLPF